MAVQGIVVENVSRVFGGLKAVDGVSLTLARGETVAIVGPNGAGKSTLVQLISGVDRADSGSIHVDGVRTDRLSSDRIARLGVGRSFQTSRVFPALTVWDSVLVGVQPGLIERPSGRLIDPVTESLGALLGLGFWRRRVKAQEAAAEAALKLFGDRLWPRRDQPALSLSYANRRRLEIARLLAAEPRYLLLDEPSAGMNPTETEELTHLILDLRRTHPQTGILVIEHKLSMVRRIADRVVVLNQGRVLIEDKPDHALDHPEVVEAYLGKPRTGASFQDAHHG
ncbi:ABC transporter ATP-binding protein [Ancylobacter oerskovii]|uniref:ABC transporter ATP-binding protein n=1 Tax=Ancylobacter oerskovii TaxID=459519 RepID=A0ABW4Z2V4_9HYPH|nr:ABC transporter ATP-binding protein [Ancylobacter oerskovii]MBS7546204.1 ABC transporter ATP-binding protein [Ancylobacter oerskovii]